MQMQLVGRGRGVNERCAVATCLFSNSIAGASATRASGLFHSRGLHHLGLSATLRALCQDIQRATGLSVVVQIAAVDGRLNMARPCSNRRTTDGGAHTRLSVKLGQRRLPPGSRDSSAQGARRIVLGACAMLKDSVCSSTSVPSAL